jgi:hypothetical protein
VTQEAPVFPGVSFAVKLVRGWHFDPQPKVLPPGGEFSIASLWLRVFAVKNHAPIDDESSS